MIIKQKNIYLLFSLCLNFYVVHADEISGRVYDDKTNKPICGAIVSCSKDQFLREIIKDGLTDSDGIYKMESITPGVYYVIAGMEPSYVPQKSQQEIKGLAKKDFALRKSDYYALKCVEVIAVDPKAKALIVKDTDGNKVELDITARTTSSSGKKITLEDDVKVGNKISATFYGITKLKGKVDNIDIERSSR